MTKEEFKKAVEELKKKQREPYIIVHPDALLWEK